MTNKTKYIPAIINNLKGIDPYKIILFGSFVKESANDDSDLDLFVILNSQKISKTYKERMSNKLLVRQKIYELSKKVPIDLIVYTKGEYDIIVKNGSSFCNEIEKTGKVLYEKTN